VALKAHGILIQILGTAKEIPVMPHWWWILWSLWRISEHQMGQFEIMLMPSALMISRLFMQWLLLAVPHHWFIKLLILRYQAYPSPSLNEIQSDHISCYVPLHPWAGHSGQGEWYFFWVTPSLPSHQFFLGMRSWPQSSLSTLTGPTRRCTTILATFELHWLTRKDGKSGVKLMSLMKFRVSYTLEMKTIAKIWV